jgi:hypothetical protein
VRREHTPTYGRGLQGEGVDLDSQRRYLYR